MRAVVVDDTGSRSRLRLAEVPDPIPGPHEVLVEVHAAAVNRADLMQREGRYPPPPGASAVLGLEVAGRVLELGEAVEGWRPGDRVCTLVPGGGYAELVAVPACTLMRVPDTVSEVEAGGAPEAFLTAFAALFEAGSARVGEVVLVHAGASGVGTAAIQLAKRAGCQVLTTVGGPAKVAACRSLGADLAVDRLAGDFEQAVAAHVATGSGAGSPLTRNVGPGGVGPPGGVDLIIDMVGRDYFERNLRLLNVTGRLVFVAAQSGADVPLRITALTSKRLSLIGITLRARSDEEKGALASAFLERFGEDWADRRVRTVVDSVYPLAAAEEAQARMYANRNIGKIVLLVREG